MGHAVVIRHWAEHNIQRAAVLQRKAREAEVDAAAEAAERFMADAASRFPAGPPPPGPPPVPPPGPPPTQPPPPGPAPMHDGTGVETTQEGGVRATPATAHERVEGSEGDDIDGSAEEDDDDG